MSEVYAKTGHTAIRAAAQRRSRAPSASMTNAPQKLAPKNAAVSGFATVQAKYSLVRKEKPNNWSPASRTRNAATPSSTRIGRMVSRIDASALELLQVGVDELDRRRSLAHGRGDPLDRAAPHVADGVHAREVGLEHVR